MHIPKLVCADCLVEMKPAAIGKCAEMVLGDGEPYYKIYGDLIECPKCRSVVFLTAGAPVATPRDDVYSNFRAAMTVTLT